MLKIIEQNKPVFARVGISIKSIIDHSTCIVDAVPVCFVKKITSGNRDQNLRKLIKNIKQLLLEVADGLSLSESVLPPLLPITINNVIASEACHGAYSFDHIMKYLIYS